MEREIRVDDQKKKIIRNFFDKSHFFGKKVRFFREKVRFFREKFDFFQEKFDFPAKSFQILPGVFWGFFSGPSRVFNFFRVATLVFFHPYKYSYVHTYVSMRDLNSTEV